MDNFSLTGKLQINSFLGNDLLYQEEGSNLVVAKARESIIKAILGEFTTLTPQIKVWTGNATDDSSWSYQYGSGVTPPTIQDVNLEIPIIENKLAIKQDCIVKYIQDNKIQITFKITITESSGSEYNINEFGLFLNDVMFARYITKKPISVKDGVTVNSNWQITFGY